MTEREIFIEAVEMRDPAARADYLQSACDGNPGLCGKIEQMLKEHFSEDSLLAGPALERGPTVVVTFSANNAGAPMLGRYKLLEKLGEGGFGEVWMAEQREPVKRRVALKIIKLGMDSRQIVARFEAERQALAMMDHPNIARIFDAGTTDAGRPFFVMELVRGMKMTRYCDQHQLATQDRLALFIKVCHAVQHAHQKGIIHRDIKPSNILVTLHDGMPVPKVIDFGIAKATQQELTNKTVFTQFQQFIGTPAYISPEQAEISGLDIDPRADIYSLGVLLYELLVGQTPFDPGQMIQGGLEALRQIIREEEPLRPSTKLNTLQGDARTTAAKCRKTEVGRLVHQLQGDLDWIVMKCLEKDRTRRYDTANALAMDIQRHLGNEPVVARPPGTAYKLQKAWRRNKLAYTAGVAVFLALAIGFALAAFGWFQALTQRDTAVRSRTREVAQRKRAELNEERANLAGNELRRRAYAAEVNSGFQALAENNLGRALDLLKRQRPKPGEDDLRGFEWRRLWQLCQSDEKVTFQEAGESGLAFSPDGKWLACAGDRIVIRELSAEAVVATISNPATTLAFSPDGKWLASGHDSHVRLWSTESWREVRSLQDARYPAVFSPDGRWLITGTAGGYRDGQWVDALGEGGYLVWSMPAGERKSYCAGGPFFTYQSRHAVAFSPDGKLLLTAGHPGGRDVAQFQVWDFPSLTVRTNFESFPFKLGSAAFAPDGKHLLVGDSVGKLMVWDIAEGRVVDTRNNEHTGAINAITCARDGRSFATASSDRTVLLWDAEQRSVLVRLRGHLDEIGSVAISPDGRMLASRSNEGATKLWNAAIRHDRRMLPGCGLVIGFSADSRLLIARGLKDSRVWQLGDDTGTTIPLENAIRLHQRGLETWASVHGIEPMAVFGRPDGVVEFWNLATMSRLTTWPAHEGIVVTAVFSPDGQIIATSGPQGDVKLWQANTRREIRRFDPVGEQVECLTFSADGRLLAGSGGMEATKPQRVRIWDVHEGHRLLDFDAHQSQVASVAFSPDGKLLATAGTDNTARLWEILSGNLKTTLKGHVQAVMGVAFSPDGKTLATGADDRKVKLWNIATEQEMVTLELLPGGCRSLRFSPDGRTLAVGSFLDPEPSMWLWQVPSFEEISAREQQETARSKQR